MQATHALCIPYIFSLFLLLDLSYHITEYHMDIICLCNIMQRQRIHAGNSCTVHALHFFLLSFVGPIISHNRISYGYHMFMQYNAEAKSMGNSCTVHALHFFLLSFVGPIISHNRISYGYCNIMQRQRVYAGNSCTVPYIFSFFLLLDLSYHITEYHMDIICLCNIMQRQRDPCRQLMHCACRGLTFFHALCIPFLSFVGPIISHNRISYGYHMFMQYNAEAKGPCRQLMHCACLTFFPG